MLLLYPVPNSLLCNYTVQQLEEEMKRFKQKCVQLEEEITLKSRKTDDLQKVKDESLALTQENTKLQANIRDLQAQIFTLQAKSPEVSSCIILDQDVLCPHANKWRQTDELEQY